VCVTGFDDEERSKLGGKIERLGGEFVEALTERVTVLVCKSRLGKIAVNAKQRGVACVSEKWLKDCEKHSVLQSVGDFKVPLLSGALISVTGVPPGDEREEIKAIVTENGGTYKGTFSYEFTHLLCAVDSIQNSKYTAALSWEVPTCDPKWLFEFIKSDGAADWRDFPVRGATPPASTSSSGSLDRKQREDREAMVRANAAETEYDVHITKVLNDAADEDNRSDDHLECCQIFLVGLNDAEKLVASKVIQTSGCTRFSEGNSGVTHIVCGRSLTYAPTANTADVLKPLQKTMFSAALVTFEWLLACHEDTEVADASAYALSLSLSSGWSSSSSPRTVVAFGAVPSKRKAPPQQPMGSSALASPQADGGGEQINFGFFNESLSSPTSRPSPSSSPSSSSSSPPDHAHADKRRKLWSGSSLHTHTSSSFSAGLFAGQSFVLGWMHLTARLNKDARQGTLQSSIEASGGRVVSANDASASPQWVVAQTLPLELRKRHPRAKVVTTVYVRHCLEKQQLVDPWSRLAFVALPKLEPLPSTSTSSSSGMRNNKALAKQQQVLAGRTICISGFISDDRAALVTIITQLGGSATETLDQKENPLMVVGERTSAKYKKACEWGVPVVDVRWLADSGCLMEAQNVEDYSNLI
jgi:BRCT domain type II-containing protein